MHLLLDRARFLRAELANGALRLDGHRRQRVREKFGHGRRRVRGIRASVAAARLGRTRGAHRQAARCAVQRGRARLPQELQGQQAEMGRVQRGFARHVLAEVQRVLLGQDVCADDRVVSGLRLVLAIKKKVY